MSNLPSPELYADHSIDFKPVEIDPGNPIDTAALEEDFESFERLDFTKHISELEALCPRWLYTQANKADIDLFLNMCRYDQLNDTLVTGCYDTSDLQFKLISYKRRRFMGQKWRTRKSTHPNNTPFTRIFTDDEPIVVVEGHHDLLTAILLGLDIVMVPTASYRGSINPDEVKNRSIIFIVEDDQCYPVMKRLAEELDPFAKDITLKRFSFDLKMDLSDYTSLHSSIQEAKGGIYYGN